MTFSLSNTMSAAIPVTTANSHRSSLSRSAATPRGAGDVPAVARALAVMDLLARERRPLHMAGIAATLALPRSSVHGLCNTLLSHGYLRRADNGSLQIGPGVMNLAEAFVANTHVAGEFDALWRDAGAPPDETLILSVLSGAEVVYVGVRNGARPLGLAFSVGMRMPAWLAASGKAMLANMPARQVRTLLPRGALSRRAGGAESATAGNTGTMAEVMADLAQTRARGYSVDDGGVREGVYAIGAPVFDATGQPVAGIAVCINKATLTEARHQRQLQVVTQAAQRLSQRLGARLDA
jgi:DNA-binding IclR family transcriptional regulator